MNNNWYCEYEEKREGHEHPKCDVQCVYCKKVEAQPTKLTKEDFNDIANGRNDEQAQPTGDTGESKTVYQDGDIKITEADCVQWHAEDAAYLRGTVSRKNSEILALQERIKQLEQQLKDVKIKFADRGAEIEKLEFQLAEVAGNAWDTGFELGKDVAYDFTTHLQANESKAAFIQSLK